MKQSIRKQLFSIYFLVVLVPVVILGTFLILHTNQFLTGYHKDLLAADNLRVRTIFDEITTQVTQIGEEIANDKDVVDLLSYQYYVDYYFKTALSKVNLQAKVDHYPAVNSIQIYTDNKHFFTEDGFVTLNHSEEWFQTATKTKEVVWWVVTDEGDSTLKQGLYLLRQIPLQNKHDNAVIAIQVNGKYLDNRIATSQYEIHISLEDGSPAYMTKGFMKAFITEEKTMSSHHNLPLYHSINLAKVSVYSPEARRNIRQIIGLCLLIAIIALVVPAVVSRFFADYFSGRILMLQNAMHKVSEGDYQIMDQIKGKDEISQAFEDLQSMVHTIEQNEAQIYEGRLREMSLEKEQQAMEFKMLASQINPHFLYNTLESIRMKAFTVGDREVADSIKMLGKSMRYVLENVGVSFVSLQKEMDHVETYLGIQKMRFSNKFCSEIKVIGGLDLGEIKMLPLLIQPVVENAILHGLEEKERDGQIEILISKANEESILRIAVRDNGCGMTAEQVDILQAAIETKDTSRNKSIGLYNINQRLKLAYGEAGRILIDSVENGGTTVCIELPLESVSDGAFMETV